MQVFRAGRLVNPNLCDTSFNRIASGYLKASQAIKSAEGAKLIVFWTHRLDSLPEFRQWVDSNYRVYMEFGNKRIYVPAPTGELPKLERGLGPSR
jgi:hypothetical protein